MFSLQSWSKADDISDRSLSFDGSSSSIVDVSNNRITLKFLDSTWIQLRSKEDQIIFSKLMNSDEEYSYFISDNYTLTAGNAGNIIVLINGNIRGKIGKKGEVLDSLFINSDFNN